MRNDRAASKLRQDKGRKAVAPKPSYRLDESLLANVPQMLRDKDQWVLWRYEDRDGKWTKVPYQSHAPTKRADSTDPQTWNPFGDVVRAYFESLKTGSPADGIGFVFAHDGGLVGFDLDNSVADTVMDPFAAGILERLGSTYCEVSPSGKGIKGIMLGSLPGAGFNRKNLGPDSRIGFEMYSA